MRPRLSWLTPILIFPLAISAPSARADVRYTTEMLFGAAPSAQASDGAAAPGVRTTTFVKDQNERVERSMQIGPMQSKTVTLTLCGQKQTIQSDPALKIYTVAPIGGETFAPPSGMGGAGGPDSGGRPRPSEKSGEGHVVTTFAAQDLGREKIQNLNTRHAMLTIHTQMSGCIGDSDTTMKMEVWTAPIKTVTCPERFQAVRTVGGDGGADGGCKVTYEMKGDVEKMKDLFSGMVVQQKFYQGDKVIMTQTLREYSLAELEPSLFTVPADYKKVSQADFAKAQQDAMRKAMMRGMGAGAGQQGEDAKEPTKTDAGTSAEAAPADDGTKKTEPAEKPKKKRIRIPGLPF